MGVSVGVNNLSVVHEGSGGVAPCFPDICKTPAPPAPPLPIPYPNIARSSDSDKTAKSVKADGKALCVKDSNFKTSTGDEGGCLHGLISNKSKGKSEFINYSFDVKFEGKNAARAFDMMFHNDKNTPPFPLLQGPVVTLPGTEEVRCLICEKKL